MTKGLSILTVLLVTVLTNTALGDPGLNIPSGLQVLSVQASKMKVGDEGNYSVKVGNFGEGTMHSFVRSDDGTYVWIESDAAVMGQNRKEETQINKATGKVVKYLLNGEEQASPMENQTVLETKKDRISVPAGTFYCDYARLKNNKDGSITEAWVNTKSIPAQGMLKISAASGYGQITIQLTSFKFAR